jgi:hypothetical protein
MKANFFQRTDSDSTSADWHSTARHCLVLTLIGLAAIAIAFILPRDETAQHTAARGAQTPVAASQAAVKAVRLPGEKNTIDPVDMPFDYFPAQFGAPQGEIDEQPPTF